MYYMPGTMFSDEDTLTNILNSQGAENVLCSIFGLFLAPVLAYFFIGRIVYFVNQHSAFCSEI